MTNLTVCMQGRVNNLTKKKQIEKRYRISSGEVLVIFLMDKIKVL